MDYRHTLNLPRTGFPMKADLVRREPQRLEKWRQLDLYQRIQEQRAGAETFLLHDGPPFANGDVHIGTALNKILKDVIVKYHTLRGRHAPYLPGWDCHGLPIEFKVSQRMRQARETESDPVSLRDRCAAYARKYIAIQREQFKRLGILGVWDEPYLTLNKGYEAEELRLFADLVEKGFVYRGKKPVYWSIPCRTALAEAEVEYRDHVSRSIYVRFPLVGHPNTYLLIWTTTPWTLPANLAVAFNSKCDYAQVRVGDVSYLVAIALLDTIAEKCGWRKVEILRSLDDAQLRQIEYQHPFCPRDGKLYDGDFVEDATGTGFVHIAPGHGLEDYGLGNQHGLPVYSPVDDDGRFTRTADLPVAQQMGDDLVGKCILEKQGMSEANQAVLETLAARNALLHEEAYIHSYPHCWRSKTPLIFRAMDQWFIRVDHQGFRDRALEAIRHVEWIPEWGRGRIESAVASRPDWCISRQRAWGVPLPAFYTESGDAILDAEVIRKIADLVETAGSNLWFATSLKDLWAKVRPSNWTGPPPVKKSMDTLDVWIDSGSSSRAVIRSRPELARHEPGARRLEPGQADLYLEGSDQHRGWFQSSLLLSLASHGAPPFKTVLTHGFMVDADREKISKSKQGPGGYQKPQTSETYVSTYGADIIRLWVASQDFRNDILVSADRIKKVSESYRGIRNALRYQLSNLFDYDPALNSVPLVELTLLDRWALARWQRLEREVLRAYERYEFHGVYQRLTQFAAVELSSVYHDLVKDRLYTLRADAPRRRSTQTVLAILAERLCAILSPILAFTCDEAWEFLPGPRRLPSVHLSQLDPFSFGPTEQETKRWEHLFHLREQVLPELEKARQAKRIGKALEAVVVLRCQDDELATLEPHLESLRELLNVSALRMVSPEETLCSIEGHPFLLAPGRTITVEPAGSLGFTKCERCWHWEPDVGADRDHPTLCGRCRDTVAAVAAEIAS